MPPPFAAEFTPELNQSYLASLLNEVNRQRTADVGAARAEGVTSGLVGQAATGSRIGAAEDNTNRRYLDTLTNFQEGVADRQYKERMTDEDRAFRAEEAKKNRDFEEQMAQLGYNFRIGEADAERGYERVQGQQGAVMGLASGLVGGGAAGAGAGIAKWIGGRGPL